MRQEKIVGILLAVSFIGIAGRGALAQDASRKVLVAYAGLISTHTSVWLGEDQGFYKKHGLDVTSVFTGSGSVTSQALIAGEAKLASTSVGPTAGAVAAGADLVILAGTIHILPYQFWVLPQVRQPADLKGKRVAVSTFGSGSHLAAEVALHSLGLDPNRDKIAIMRRARNAGVDRAGLQSGNDLADVTELDVLQILKCIDLESGERCLSKHIRIRAYPVNAQPLALQILHAGNILLTDDLTRDTVFALPDDHQTFGAAHHSS